MKISLSPISSVFLALILSALTVSCKPPSDAGDPTEPGTKTAPDPAAEAPAEAPEAPEAGGSDEPASKPDGEAEKQAPDSAAAPKGSGPAPSLTQETGGPPVVTSFADIKDKDPRPELKKKLTKMQYEVTVKNGTEPPFRNEYWDNKEPGIYVDIISGKPLFSSTHKFKSGTGWPSFWEVIDSEEVLKKEDRSHGMVRVEVRSKSGDSHLGHVFADGPQPTGLRYCINSASLRFVPKAKLKEEGLGKYLELFEEGEGKAETKKSGAEEKDS